ncbi:hypothetical protein [Streptomyces sp. NPDC002490]|uniref:hypothetical protein n=1 Tax=Streptomyces sp. NPDC002490 TaxID=3154416 RepID=UPI00332A2468
MTTHDLMVVDTMWTAAKLNRAYLSQDSTRIATCLDEAKRDVHHLEHVVVWCSLQHDDLFAELGEPSMSSRALTVTAALAPPEVEFAVTTALRRVAEIGLRRAVGALDLSHQAHALAICSTVLMMEAFGRTEALKRLDNDDAMREEVVRRSRPARDKNV